ncbi:hypothetical protein V495_08607 [Pseudogymnoascus sp. VKM F-4514 (FW-929)]|nr:hypothetical protein V495_08607 [Pseudogymnoascus sp. VKM F-4514 (FW-929)]KFY51814.1 hypothetical protein V497_08827 [Pseudogymnoascus sp. VKM F-4516 (FW-969)]
MVWANSPPLSALPISLRAIVFVLCLLLSQVSPAQSAVCYDSSGLASGPESKKPFFPCESDAGVTSCCEPGDICFSNGLCSPGPALKASHPPGFYITTFFWNACTDPSFQDPKCFTGCFSDLGNGVQSCPEAGPNAYCCYGYNGCNCADPSQIIHVEAGSIIGTIDLDVKFPSSTLPSTSPSTPTPSSESTIHTTPSAPSTEAAPSESSTHASPSPSSTDATSSTSASKEAPETTTSPETSTPANTPSQAEENTPSSTPVPKDKDATETSTSPEPITSTNPPTQAQENKSLAIPIGVGVGVSGAILIAIIVIAIIFLRRRRQKAVVPYWEPPLTYETKPYEAHSDDAYPNEAPSDEAYHEMITRYNTTELSSVTPAQRYRELHSPGLHPPGLHSPT